MLGGHPLAQLLRKLEKSMLDSDVTPLILLKNPVGGVGMLVGYFGLIKGKGRE